MKTLTINNRTFLAIKVPEISKNHKVIMNYLWFTLRSIVETDEVELPPGTYSEPFLLSQVDEERACGMVSVYHKHSGFTTFSNYEDVKNWDAAYGTALESFHSWLRANEVLTTESKEWILIEQLTSK